jgi:glycosyltransferase involved in cell wall biosynthesis
MHTQPLIICASTQYWDEAWFRKQHFMRRLAQQRPVMYVEPTFSIVRRAPGRCPAGSVNPCFHARTRTIDERLTVLTPPRGLPGWTHARVSPIHYRRMGALLRRTAHRAGHARTWLWLYNPLYVQAIDALGPERVIFDLVDDLGAYAARGHSRETMRRCVEAALERADLVLTTSPLLAERYASRTRAGRMHVVPNGVRGDWIDRPPGEPPAELKALPRPWIGFIGAIFEYLDYDLLIATARAFPEGSLVLVGPVRDAAGAARLRGEPNVAWVGPQPQARVPEFAAAFDVCLSPFRAGAVRRAVNPLKIYEYLAAGRPVVSTPLESLADDPVARYIRFAEGEAAFVGAVREALAQEDGAAVDAGPAVDRVGTAVARARREALRAYTWEALGDRVAAILERAERAWAGEAPRAGAGPEDDGPEGDRPEGDAP